MKNIELKDEFIDEKTRIEYIRNGDYYLPNLVLADQKKIQLNKYGHLRLEYLKKHKKAEYTILFMDNKLIDHLEEVQETASKRVEEKYVISLQGEKIVENHIMKLNYETSKILWLETIVKVLTIYEDNFLSKLIKEDPNVSFMNSGNQKTKIPTNDTEENLSNELVKYLEENGREKLKLEGKADEEYLLLFFDLLYRKYKGGR